MQLKPIINSLLDTDLYKFNMNQVMFHKHTDLCGEYYFKCRNKGVKFTHEQVEEINAQIDHLCSLTFKDDELAYLRTIRFLKPDFVEFLRLWRPIRDYVTVAEEGNIIPTKMPFKYVVESFCDMVGAGKAYSGKKWTAKDPLRYYEEKCKGKRIMHPDSIKLLEKLLNAMVQYGEKEFIRWFKTHKLELEKTY